jgi:hypothetical protein
MNAPGSLPRWPKGPFPERYRFAAVQARLGAGWDAERAQALASLVGGLEALGPDDPWVRLYRLRDEGAVDRRALRTSARERGLTAFDWIAPARARRDGAAPEGVVGFAPSGDLVEAVSAVGVAGPMHGIGLPAVVRFLVTLRSFARHDVLAMGEDCLVLELAPRDEDALVRVAERVLRICPPLARSSTADEVAHTVRDTGILRMDWA